MNAHLLKAHACSCLHSVCVPARGSSLSSRDLHHLPNGRVVNQLLVCAVPWMPCPGTNRLPTSTIGGARNYFLIIKNDNGAAVLNARPFSLRFFHVVCLCLFLFFLHLYTPFPFICCFSRFGLSFFLFFFNFKYGYKIFKLFKCHALVGV